MRFIQQLILLILSMLTLLSPLHAQEFADPMWEEEPFEEGTFDPGEELVALPSEGTEVILFVHDPEFEWEESQLTIGHGEAYAQTIRLEDRKELYQIHLPLIIESAHVPIKLGDQFGELSLPHRPDLGAIYIGMREPRFFPHDIDIWTQQDVLRKGKPIQIRIEGELPIGMVDQVSLEIPYHRWPETSDHISAEVKPSDDWKLSEFHLYGSISRSTIVFLHIEDRYFPILTDRHHDHDIDIVFALNDQNKLVISELDRYDSGQRFLNERYQYRGMTKQQYGQWLRAFEESESSNEFLMQLQQEIGAVGVSEDELEEQLNELVDAMISPSPEVLDSKEDKQTFIWYIQEKINEYSRTEQELDGDMSELIQTLGDLESQGWHHAFAHSYHEYIHRDSSRVIESSNDFLGLVLPGFLLSMALLIVAFVASYRKPNSFLAQNLFKVELALFSFAILLIGEAMLIQNYGSGIVMTTPLYGWFLYLTVITTFFINVYFLTPSMFGKGKFSRYLLNTGIMVFAVIVAFWIHSLNPIGNLTLLSIGGDRQLIDFPVNFHHNDYDNFIALQIMIFLGSTIYGIGRHLLVRRLPQLTQKSNALNAELVALKHQISPHFFFNSLNTVYSFSLSEDSPKTSEAITKLSDMMRFVIYDGAQEKISLEKELTYIEDYVELQRLRLDPQKHQFNFRVDGDPTGLTIAPLILITLIENAFKHGISMNQASFIYISLLIQEGGLILTVENSNFANKVLAGEGESVEGGIGLVNTRQRLDMLYPKQYDWYAEEKGDTYFTQLSIDLNP